MAEIVIVKTALGELRGTTKTTSKREKIYAFLGVPYAKPPVGDLRFKDPEPIEAWDGVRSAVKSPAVAPSVVATAKGVAVNPQSSEDCLYLNIYTPKPPCNEETLPVMVFFHGGGFTYGNGNYEAIRPDYLVPNGVVLVTVNYRLGAFGFLSLQTKECPGNFGLKDQNLALKWIQRNIFPFGGDPNNVTIYGWSAGAACVHYHMLSPMSRGLFHKAIAQSGSALNRCTYARNPRKSGMLLAKLLGNTSESEADALNVLKKAPVEAILKFSVGLFAKIEGLWAGEHCLNFAFTPTCEPEGTANAFLPSTPENLMRNGQCADVPFLTGVTTHEGIYCLTCEDYVPPWKDDAGYQMLLPKELGVPLGSKKSLEAARKLQDFYFPEGATQEGFVRVITEVVTAYSIWKTLEILEGNKNKRTNNYLYIFAASRENSTMKQLFDLTEVSGSCHGDDIDYLFPMAGTEPIAVDSHDETIQKRMVAFWTNFAKTGVPSEDWPCSKKTPEGYPYAFIDYTFKAMNGFYAKEMQFCDDLYSFMKS